MAREVEDLEVYVRALEFWDAVNPLRDRPRMLQNPRLRGQILEALDSVVANIAEGFEQPTDRAFANYLFHSKASASEVRTRLALACRRRYITEAELGKANGLGLEVGRMLMGLIRYLLRSNRRDRGLKS